MSMKVDVVIFNLLEGRKVAYVYDEGKAVEILSEQEVPPGPDYNFLKGLDGDTVVELIKSDNTIQLIDCRE